MDSAMKCPGKYCGIRTELPDNNTVCGPCPWGYRVNPGTYQCDPCRQSLLWHDYMYLAFVAILPALIHSFYHEITIGRQSPSKMWPVLYVYLVLETAVSAVITLAVLPPLGSFNLYSCGVQEFSDWYPMFSNPTIRSQQRLHCTHEVVYPLYSLPFIFFGIWFLFSVGLRPLFSIKLKSDAIGAIGPSLYFCPLIVLAHAACAGLIYYGFPYMMVVASLSISAVLMATFPEQTIRGLVNVIKGQPRQAFLLLSLIFLNALCVLSLFNAVPRVTQLWVFLVVPAPVVFYIITVPFTDPSKLALSSQA